MIELLIFCCVVGIAIQIWIVNSIRKLNARVELLSILATGDENTSTEQDTKTLEEMIKAKRKKK